MARLTYHADAKIEAREAARHYGERDPGLGERFLIAIDETAERVKARPEMWRVIDGPYRRAMVHGFPYALIYRVDDDHVFVAAVMHLKRRPGYWRRRVQDEP